MRSPLLSEKPSEAARPADVSPADWRVLLPPPAGGAFAGLLLVGGSPDLASLLMDIGLTKQVVTGLPREQTVRAAAILSGAVVSPMELGPCLGPDTVLYWEVPAAGSSGARRPGDISALLRRCGFTADFEDCRSYQPLESPNADRWYRGQKKSPLRLRIPFRPSGKPVCVAWIAVRRETRARRLRRGILEWSPRAPLASADRLLVEKRRGRRNRNRRLIVFAFSETDRDPRGVLKIARTGDDRARIEEEQRALISIRERLSDSLKASLPEPLGSFEAGGSLVGTETCVTGRPRARGFRERRRQLDLAASWIADFHRKTEVSRRPWGPADCEKWVAAPVAAYRQSLESGDRDSGLFEALAARGREVAGLSLPLVWRHGDFNESNVLFTSDGLRVFDWESARIGLPLFDLLYFATNWVYRTERLTEPAERLRRFGELWRQRGGTGDAVCRMVWTAVDGYLAKLDIDPRFTPLLIALHSIYWASPDEVGVLAVGRERLFGGIHA